MTLAGRAASCGPAGPVRPERRTPVAVLLLIVAWCAVAVVIAPAVGRMLARKGG